MPLRVIKIQLGTTDGKRFTENPTRFEQCVESVAARGGAYDPKAVCAAAGRKKYGKRKFAAMAAAGRRRAAKNPDLSSIRSGDRVSIVNRFGQVRTGRAVMRGPYGWVLNMGGPHGTPDIADETNIVKVVRKRSNSVRTLKKKTLRGKR